MSDGRRNERDLILAPNEYAFLLDETKGNVINYVGPHKTSLANTDRPVYFDPQTKRFVRCTLDQAIRLHAVAPEGWYLVLKNPEPNNKHPRTGSANTLPELDIGRKVNTPGPVSFAPWPGQMIRVIQGHRLRSNQYLVVRVYDDEGAKENWTKAVIKPQTSPPGSEETSPEKSTEEPLLTADMPDLTMGKLLVIKGTDVSFYIPPTGIEVVPNDNGHYVRNAVTLERLEYCILLDEDGHKRYIIGPAVVFPEPTEVFVEKSGSRKFKAIELNEISGLYIKVIAPYKDGKQSYKLGDELFITGKDQMIYFPRIEHAIIRYGDREVHHAVAIPEGEARYVLNRLTGQITLRRGPDMFLPDPRKEVIVRRVIDLKQVALWFPGNQEALEYNRRLLAITRSEKGKVFVPDGEAKKLFKAKEKVARPATVSEAEDTFVGDEFTRQQQFTPPRTITLDTKYESAVSISIWTGYAVLVIGKAGERKVIVGPATYLLEYDEMLETVQLSTGTPKQDDKLMKTVYLRVLHNKVSDIVDAETLDFARVKLHLSYRVNFEGEPKKWYNVENYVKFLTDHMRSILRHVIKQRGIEDFYANAISIIRDTVLGKANDKGVRTGRIFTENGMRIYDVEALNITIEDKPIAQLLINSQHSAIQQDLELTAEKRNQELTEQKEIIRQKIAEAKAITKQLMLNLDTEEVKKQHELTLTKLNAEIEAAEKKLQARLDEQESLEKIKTAELSRQKAEHDLKLDVARQQLEQRLENLKAEVEAVVNKAGAISPQLIAALQSFSDKALAESMAESMAPLAILGGNSVADVFAQLIKGTVLEEVLTKKTIDHE